MIKLSDIIRENKEEWYLNEQSFVPANVDLVFGIIRDKNINEIIVNKEQMKAILTYFLGTSGNTEIGSKCLTEGKVEKIFGVNLILE